MRVRALLHMACAALLLSTSGCDAGSVTTTPDDGSSTGVPDPLKQPDAGSTPPDAGHASIFIDAPAVVTLSPADTFRLRFTVLDSSGTSPSAVLPTWSSEIGERVAVDRDGLLRAGDTPGHSWVVVEVGALRDSVGVWVQPLQSTPSNFEITLHFEQGVPPWWPPSLEAAARRWKAAIRASLPSVAVADLENHCGHVSHLPPGLLGGLESGVRIFVRVSSELPADGTPRATGGVCVNRGLPAPTSVVGLVTLNAHSLDDGPPTDLAYLAHHEMGHALGLVGAVQGDVPGWLDPTTGTYRGHLALFGRHLDGHEQPTAIELGSAGHWPFADLMGTPRANTVSHATIGALMDLGYPAAWYGSGPIEE